MPSNPALFYTPPVRSGRSLMFGCMLLGSLMIVAMSSWLNASALAGAAAIQQHLSITVQNYTRDLDTANSNAIAAQGLLPDIQLPSSRFAKLADAERAGSLTGTAGSGTVVQLLTQMSGQLDSLGQELKSLNIVTTGVTPVASPVPAAPGAAPSPAVPKARS